MSFETNLNELSNQHLAFVILHLFLSRQLVRHYVAPYTCFVVKKHFPISNDHSAQHDVILKRQFGMQKRERESLRLDASSTRYLISDCVMMTNTDRSLPISPAVQHSLLLCERIHWIGYACDGFQICDCKIVDDHSCR